MFILHDKMRGVLTLLLIGFKINLSKASGDPPVWQVPSTGSLTTTVNEDEPAGNGFLDLSVTDNENDVITFSILSQDPSLPEFNLVGSLLKVPVGGLDAETTSSFTFNFRANDGTTDVDSVTFTLTVGDVNEASPVFLPTSYTGSTEDGVTAGTTVATVTATDADVSSSLTFTIPVGNTGNTFAVSNNGEITVSVPANIDSTTTPTYTLTVRASDGTNTADAMVTITVLANPCLPNPCQNSGTCASSGSTYTCTCASGWMGTNCDTADPCSPNPCQNSGTCASSGSTYTCTCASGWTGTNCDAADPCSPNPCQNSGTCASSGSTHTCTCASGWTGTNCDAVSNTVKQGSDNSERNLGLGLGLGLPAGLCACGLVGYGVKKLNSHMSDEHKEGTDDDLKEEPTEIKANANGDGTLYP